MATLDFSRPRNQEMGVIYSCRYDAWPGRYTVKGRYSFRDNHGDPYWIDLRVSFNKDGDNLQYGSADGMDLAVLRLIDLIAIVFALLFILGQPGVMRDRGYTLPKGQPVTASRSD